MPRSWSRLMPAQALAPPCECAARRPARSPLRFATLGNGAEDPHQLAALDVEGAHVARRRGQALGDAAAEDQQIAVARRRECWPPRTTRPRAASRPRWRSIDPLSPKLAIGSPLLGVERPQPIAAREEDPGALACAPVRETAIHPEPEQSIPRRTGRSARAPRRWPHRGRTPRAKARCRRGRRRPRSGCTGSANGSRVGAAGAIRPRQLEARDVPWVDLGRRASTALDRRRRDTRAIRASGAAARLEASPQPSAASAASATATRDASACGSTSRSGAWPSLAPAPGRRSPAPRPRTRAGRC